jgi:hypothetical protein
MSGSIGSDRVVLEALAGLCTDGETEHRDFLMEQGIIWQITSTRPNIIFCGENYVPTREDGRLFGLFEVSRLNL